MSSSSSSSSSSLKKYLNVLIDGERHLTSEEAEDAFGVILSGEFDPVQVGSLLCLLRARGETAEELAGFVRAMNGACRSVVLEEKALDIVGTGGDGADTINISTASVVLAAACGCTVAKAGNRSVSSACGSADVLEQLGVQVDLSPTEVEECVKECGIAFMFAPVNHPAMKYVAPIRGSLQIRTVFNILGPMTNAAQASRTVIGVFHPHLQPLMAQALQKVGRVDHAVIIHGVGLDEISPLGPATIVEIINTAAAGVTPKVYKQQTIILDPLKDFNIPRCDLIDLKGGNPQQNKQEFIDVLLPGQHTNAKRDSIILNAGLGLYVYGLTPTIAEGVKLARTTLQSGKAQQKLQHWINVSQNIRNNNNK